MSYYFKNPTIPLISVHLSSILHFRAPLYPDAPFLGSISYDVSTFPSRCQPEIIVL